MLTRQRRYYFPGRSPTSLRDPNAHVYTLSIQIMIRKLVYLSFYDPQCGRCHRHYTPIATLLFSDQRRTCEVTLRYLPPSLDSYLTTSPGAQISWIVLPFSRPIPIVGMAFHDTFFVPMGGGERIVMEVFVFFYVHNRRSWTTMFG